MKSAFSGFMSFRNMAWIAASWLIPAVLIKFFILPDWHSLGYFMVADDLYSMIWNAEHGKLSLQQSGNLFHTQSILAPEGVGLWTHTYTLMFGLVNVVVNNAVFAVNVSVFLHLVAFSAGVFALTSCWIKSPTYRLVISLLAVFNGYVLAKSGIHLNLILLGWMPWNLFVFFISFDKDANLKRPNLLLISGIMLAVNLAFDYYMILYSLSFVFLWVVYQYWIKKILLNTNWKQWLFFLVLLVLIHIASRLLFLNGFDNKGGLWDAPDIRAFLTPGSLGRWVFSDAVFPKSPLTENFVFAGFAMLGMLVLCVYFYFNKRKEYLNARLWFFMMLCFWCLVFPVVKWEGKNLFFFPNSIIHYVPILDQFRAPGRMFIMFNFSALVFIFVMLEGIHWRRIWIRNGLIALFVGGFIFEHVVRDKERLQEDTVVPSVADKKYLRGKTVLTLPFGVRDGFRMLGNYQVTDALLIGVPEARLCSGYISRIPEDVWKSLTQKGWIQLSVQMSDTSSFIANMPAQWARSVNDSQIEVVRISHIGESENEKIRHGVAVLTKEYRWRNFTENGILYLVR